MISKSYLGDRVLHWVSAILLLLMLMNLSTQLHNVDWDIKGQLEHRQGAVEMHAVVGVTLVVFTVARLLFPYFVRTPIKRIEPRSTSHALFIKATHVGLYTCIISLAGTGLVLINNYEIPLTVLGFDLAPDRDAFYSLFPKVHAIHMALKQAIWWLIAIHLIGILYAKR